MGHIKGLLSVPECPPETKMASFFTVIAFFFSSFQTLLVNKVEALSWKMCQRNADTDITVITVPSPHNPLNSSILKKMTIPFITLFQYTD